MKQKHMYSLLDQTYTTAHVTFPSYNPDEDYDRDERDRRPRGWSPRSTYVYKVPLTWNVQEGDELLVETSAGLVIVNVVKVDATPDIDVDANFDYKWAVQRVDRTEYNDLVEKEKRFAASLQEIERIKQRDSLLASFRESLPEGSAARALFEQTTASLQAPVAPKAPPAPPMDGKVPNNPPAAPWESAE